MEAIERFAWPLCSEYCIPDRLRSLAIESQPVQRELSFVDASEQFYASDCDGGRFEVLEAKHRSGSGFDTTMVPLDEVVQVLRGPQFRAPGQQAVLSHLTDCAMRRS